jgi:hypothetical protein
VNNNFIDIGQNVKIRQEPYRILQMNFKEVEIELLAYRLRLSRESGEPVEGTALRQIEFPVSNQTIKSWYIAYLADKAFDEIFIVSISPKPLRFAEGLLDAAKMEQILARIIEAALRMMLRY